MSETQYHTYLRPEHSLGNGNIGRIFIASGDPTRAAKIASYFTQITEAIENPRKLDAFIGFIETEYGDVDLASVTHQMGPGSMEITGYEFDEIGMKNLIRAGSSGTVQPNAGFGTFVITEGAVKDDGASSDYAPKEFPAVCHYTTVIALARASIELGFDDRTIIGLTHSKASLFAREGGAKCPNQAENKAYMKKLNLFGVVNSEMEIAVPATQAQCRRPILTVRDILKDPNQEIKVGCVCVIINQYHDDSVEGTGKLFDPDKEQIEKADEDLAKMAIQGAVELYAILSGQKPII